MSARTVPLAAMLSVVPYFRARGGSAPVAEAARDLGMTQRQLRDVLWQLWMCGLPGYGPGDLIDLSFSADDLDDADLVEVTFTAGMDRPVRLTWTEAVTLETGLAAFLDHPEVVDQDSLRDLIATLRSATGTGGAPGPAVAGRRDDADVVRRAVDGARALRFTYHSASSDSTRTRVVDPVRITVADGHSYLRGVDRDTGTWRTFRTDRMSDVEEVGPRRAVGPEPESPGTGEPPEGRADATLRATSRWFLDEFPFQDVRERPGGDLAVTIAYHDREWLVRFLLGHADVLVPSDPTLRAEVVDRARAALTSRLDDPPDGHRPTTG